MKIPESKKPRIETTIIPYLDNVKHHGGYILSLCPFHDDSTPSFAIYPKTQTYKCFGCGAFGDVITFFRKLKGLSFVEALHYLNIDSKQESSSVDDLIKSLVPTSAKEEIPVELILRVRNLRYSLSEDELARVLYDVHLLLFRGAYESLGRLLTKYDC